MAANATEDNDFARLVLLACHDLRTPLATVHGFAQTLVRTGEFEDPAARYLEMIDTASGQIADLIDELAHADERLREAVHRGERRAQVVARQQDEAGEIALFLHAVHILTDSVSTGHFRRAHERSSPALMAASLAVCKRGVGSVAAMPQVAAHA